MPTIRISQGLLFTLLSLLLMLLIVPAWAQAPPKHSVMQEDVGAINALRYMKCDGITDDAQGLRNALANAPNTKATTITFPSGTCLIGSTVSFKDKYNVTLKAPSVARRGADSQATTLLYTAASGGLFAFEGAVGIEIKGFNLAYSHASYAGNFLDLAQGTGAVLTSEISFIDNRIGGLSTSSKAANTLIHAAELVYNINIERNVFTNGRTAIEGSLLSTINSNIIRIRDNLFLCCFAISHIRAGGASWLIQDNTFEPISPSLLGWAFDTTTVGVTGLRYAGNWHGDAQDTGSHWFTVFGGPIHGGAITGANTFQSTAGYCIYLGTASTGIVISGNSFNCPTNLIPSTSQDIISLGNDFVAGAPYQNYPNAASFIQNPGIGFQMGAGALAQSSPMLGLRNTQNALEWGAANQAGYGSTLGATGGGGHPFVCLNCEAGSSAGTYTTRGVIGRIIESDTAGRMIFGAAVGSNTPNQTLAGHMRLDTYGNMELGITSGSGPALSGCGTSPSIVGTNVAGRATTGTAMGTTCTVTFGGAGWANTPICVVQPEGTIDTVTTASVTTTSFQIAKTGGGNLSASTVFNYICLGRF